MFVGNNFKLKATIEQIKHFSAYIDRGTQYYIPSYDKVMTEGERLDEGRKCIGKGYIELEEFMWLEEYAKILCDRCDSSYKSARGRASIWYG